MTEPTHSFITRTIDAVLVGPNARFLPFSMGFLSLSNAFSFFRQLASLSFSSPIRLHVFSFFSLLHYLFID